MPFSRNNVILLDISAVQVLLLHPASKVLATSIQRCLITDFMICGYGDFASEQHISICANLRDSFHKFCRGSCTTVTFLFFLVCHKHFLTTAANLPVLILAKWEKFMRCLNCSIIPAKFWSHLQTFKINQTYRSSKLSPL